MPLTAKPLPLDVAVVMFDFGPTGVVRNAIRIAAAAARAGLSTELWVVQDRGSLRSEVPDGVPIHAFGPTLGTNYSRSDRRRTGKATVPALAAMLAERRPRVLLSAGNHFHSPAASAIRQAGVDTKLLLRISTGLPCPEHTLNPYRWLRYHYKRRKAERRHESASRLIAVSEEIARELKRSNDVGSEQLVVIPNGIDRLSIESRAQEPFGHDWFQPGAPPVILGVGRIDKFKNFELLIAAFAELRKSRPLRLMILGEERSAWRHRLEAQAQRLGVAEDLRFEGFQPNPHPYFRRAAAYVCCSRYEGMSNAMLEAMANGCPVVATRTATGAAELLEDGRLGPLAEVGTKALARAIATRIDQPRQSEALMARAARYDLKLSIASYVRLLAAEAGRVTNLKVGSELAELSAKPLAA
jgi:glycosyltransferase involved in cell wall biosynthesis